MQSTRKPTKPVVFKYKVGDIVRLKSEYISYIDNPEYKSVVKIAKVRRSKNQPYYLFEGLKVWQHEAYIAGPVEHTDAVE